MNIVSSYGIEIKYMQKHLRLTADIFRKAVAFLISAFDQEWDKLSLIDDLKKQFNAAEALIHETKENQPAYQFDREFPCMPSYMRRAAIQKALGSVKSYRSNYANWVRNGRKGNPPKLAPETHLTPTFYKTNMYLKDGRNVKIKLYNGRNWVWEDLDLKKTDLDYIDRYWFHCDPSSPSLERKHKKWFLRFSFSENVELAELDKCPAGKICAVDLGVNTDAVCVIIHPDGTVAKRKFINFPAEKDCLWRILGRIKKRQREHGPISARDLWAYAKRLNDELAKKIAAAIVDFATENGADTIVFEHLGKMKKACGRRKQKLALWRKNGIQDYAAHDAHRAGMRISRICPWGTSKLAFDGSGETERGIDDNYSICRFQNGKVYNCDLNATYNIGSRYYLRELLKPLPETARSQLEAKVPSAARRTECTLSTLLAVYRELQVKAG